MNMMDVRKKVCRRHIRENHLLLCQLAVCDPFLRHLGFFLCVCFEWKSQQNQSEQ
jgi:hypothetical protein